MAKIRSGILGNIRGKVSGVVGGQWKDVNYLREYVKPANPDTAAQQVQRTKMTDVVLFCKALVGPVFNAYTDKFQKSMSGFNRFIKTNIVEFDGSPVYANLKLTEGVLWAPTGMSAEKPEPGVTCGITWTKSLGNNGALTDSIYAAVHDTDTGLWYFPAAEVIRDDEAIAVTVPNESLAASLEVYVWAIRMAGAIVDAISTSVHDQAETPA